MEHTSPSETDLLLVLWHSHTCPFCGKQIHEGSRVGTGRIVEGGFCSLTCYAEYHGLDREARQTLLAKRVTD
jgi:hypothetical protein